jgi:NhaA family Na+:H+ antiporter
MALVTGVGFTMSLFVGTLAFDDLHTQTAVHLGIIIGSLASGLAGYVVLRIVGHKHSIGSSAPKMNEELNY